MSFARYPEYKHSGVDWLGEVPGHWGVAPLGALSALIQTGPFGSQLHSDEYVESQIPVINPSNIRDGQLVADLACTVGVEVAHRLEHHRLELGDIVVGRRGEMGRCAVVSPESVGWICGTGSLNVRLHSHIKSQFVGAFLRTNFVREWLSLESVGSTMDNLNTRILARVPVPCPPNQEQTAIATFLDSETAKIDTLVAEQEKLIALLQEKRQAVISHAVTKGLDPSVPMKDSGVEWLGEVPGHWVVMPIRLAARLESGHTPSRSRPDWWQDCTVPWFTLADVWQIRDGGADVVYETKEMVSELGLANSSARLLPKGTVMLSRTASVGFSAIMGVDMATTQDFANWVCGEKLLPDFLLQVFRSMKGEFWRLMMGSTHNTIYMPDIQAFRFALPSHSEQLSIVEHIREKASVFDSLISEAEIAVRLLTERRTALISAAVTGQIDVRNT